jgi:predicted nucleic acid-binding Zn ribbon protein
VRRRRRDPVAVGALLPRVLHDLGLGAPARVLRIAERWAEAVGPELARRSQPLALRGDELEVGVESSVWCQQLQLQVPWILERLRAVLADDAPAKLRLRLAPPAREPGGGPG